MTREWIYGMKAALRVNVPMVGVLMVVGLAANAQGTHPRPSLKDSLDRKFDMSDYIIEANGFVPVPYIITEPAVGGFGGALAPIFIKKRPPFMDSVKGRWVRTPVAPDV